MTEVAAHKDAIVKHTAELDHRSLRIGAHVSQIADLEAERNKLSTEVSTHKDTIEEHTAELERRAGRIKTLRDRSRGRLSGHSRAGEGRLQEGGTDVEQRLLARVESLRKQSRGRLKEIRRLEKEAAEPAGDEAQRLERKLAAARKRARERGRSVRKLEAESIALKEACSKATSEVESLRADLDKLTDDIDPASEGALRPVPHMLRRGETNE